MKLKCTHLEDFEWAAAQRNMGLFSTAPCMYVVHALMPAYKGKRLVCGAFNTKLSKGVVFDNHADYIDWLGSLSEEPDLAMMQQPNGEPVFCTVYLENQNEPASFTTRPN